MAEIRILHSAHEGTVKLNLNGESFTLQLPRDNSHTSVPDRFLPLLADSNIDYEIVAPVAGNDEAGAGAGGDSGAASAEADGPLPGAEPEPGPIPTPDVESPTFDASSNTAMPASPPNPSPSAPAPPVTPDDKAKAGKVAKPKKAPAGKNPTAPKKPAKAK